MLFSGAIKSLYVKNKSQFKLLVIIELNKVINIAKQFCLPVMVVYKKAKH